MDIWRIMTRVIIKDNARSLNDSSYIYIYGYLFLIRVAPHVAEATWV